MDAATKTIYPRHREFEEETLTAFGFTVISPKPPDRKSTPELSAEKIPIGLVKQPPSEQRDNGNTDYDDSEKIQVSLISFALIFVRFAGYFYAHSSIWLE